MLKLKILIHKSICNYFSGGLLRVLYPSGYIPFAGSKIYLKSKKIHNATIAAIFLGFYEKSERRFIKKHVAQNRNIIELGSSLGVISSQLAKKKPSKLICVEANPYLIDGLEKTLRTTGSQFGLINKAISYTDSKVMLNITDFTSMSSIYESNQVSEKVEVECCTLSQIISQTNLRNYILVSDIEGAEIEFLLNDSLSQCHLMIIELHNATYESKKYTVPEMVDIITSKHNFINIESHGSVYVFKK